VLPNTKADKKAKYIKEGLISPEEQTTAMLLFEK
jgi:hypothetical protein